MMATFYRVGCRLDPKAGVSKHWQVGPLVLPRQILERHVTTASELGGALSRLAPGAKREPLRG